MSNEHAWIADNSPRDNCRLLFPVPVSDTFLFIYELTVWPLSVAVLLMRIQFLLEVDYFLHCISFS